MVITNEELRQIIKIVREEPGISLNKLTEKMSNYVRHKESLKIRLEKLINDDVLTIEKEEKQWKIYLTRHYEELITKLFTLEQEYSTFEKKYNLYNKFGKLELTIHFLHRITIIHFYLMTKSFLHKQGIYDYTLANELLQDILIKTRELFQKDFTDAESKKDKFLLRFEEQSEILSLYLQKVSKYKEEWAVAKCNYTRQYRTMSEFLADFGTTGIPLQSLLYTSLPEWVLDHKLEDILLTLFRNPKPPLQIDKLTNSESISNYNNFIDSDSESSDAYFWWRFGDLDDSIITKINEDYKKTHLEI